MFFFFLEFEVLVDIRFHDFVSLLQHMFAICDHKRYFIISWYSILIFIFIIKLSGYNFKSHYSFTIFFFGHMDYFALKETLYGLCYIETFALSKCQECHMKQEF